MFSNFYIFVTYSCFDFSLKEYYNMKKVFNLLVSFVLIAGFSACSKDDSGNQQQEPEYPSPTPVPTAD